MFNLTSTPPKSWQTVSRQADRINAEQTYTHVADSIPSIQELGIVLRDRREALGASLAEVETATRIRQKYLAALESDEWHLLPGEVVGRGFLRNYATYLGLDPTELVERRRTVADPSLASSLTGTSAGSPLPPERDVDYRPKDVALKDEPEGIQQREIRTGPMFTILGGFGALLLVWWVVTSFGGQIGNGIAATVDGLQTRVASGEAPIAPTATLAINSGSGDTTAPVVPMAIPFSTENVPNNDIPNGNNAIPGNNAQGEGMAPTVEAVIPPQNEPESEENNSPVIIEPTPTPTTQEIQRILIPTNTSVLVDNPSVTSAEVNENFVPTNTPFPPPPQAPPPSPPTNTPVPLVPTNTPVPTPTEVPTVGPPPIVAPGCPDPRSILSTPGVNQTLAGAVSVTGSAIHEAFQYYKLEYAFGANASDGFVYFDGANSPVDGGILGTLNTPSLPNGAYTLQLTVVDLTANYPPPCRVSVVIQN